jgi:hypothetical protein
MRTLRKVTGNRRLGGIAEDMVGAHLSYFSTPMRVPPHHDVGIDYYCELRTNYQSYPRFFCVQAKGTRHFKRNWGQSIEKETVRHWLSQPFPVYIIVYDQEDKTCYWMSVEEKRPSFLKRLKTDKKTIYVTVDKSKVLEEGANPYFISTIEKDAESMRFRLSLAQGVPQMVGTGYVKRKLLIQLPKPLEGLVRDRIRQSIGYLIGHYILGQDIPKAYFLCRFLTEFDKGHYDHFALFGELCRFLGKKDEACLSYQKAIEICKRDKNWDRLKKPSDHSIKDLISSIEKRMESLNC